MEDLVAILIGFFAGTVSGLVGIGGGSIIVPALMLLLGLGIKKAIGVSLAVMIPAAMASLIKHSNDRKIDFKIFPFLCLGSLCGGYLGASLSAVTSPLILGKILGFSLVLIGVNTVFNITGKIKSRRLSYNLETGDEEAEEQKKADLILFYDI